MRHLHTSLAALCVLRPKWFITIIHVMNKYINYSAPVGVRVIVINPSVCECLSLCVTVCPQAYLWNRFTNLNEILCADPSDRGSVLL